MKRIMKFAYGQWMRFARCIGLINSIVLLSLFYLIFIGLYALCYKLFRIFTILRFNKPPDSYWIDMVYVPPTQDALGRMF